jgi:hypothetical protein
MHDSILTTLSNKEKDITNKFANAAPSFSLTFLFLFSSPNSLPSSLREKGTSLRLPAALFIPITFLFLFGRFLILVQLRRGSPAANCTISTFNSAPLGIE